MRGFLLGAVAALGLSACDTRASDGYFFERREFDRGQVTVTVVRHQSVAALRQEAARRGVVVEGRDLMGFGFVAPDRPTCTIHIVDPAARYTPEWIGHELTHCLHGRWHGASGS